VPVAEGERQQGGGFLHAACLARLQAGHGWCSPSGPDGDGG
jgi:hypothetical protein